MPNSNAKMFPKTIYPTITTQNRYKCQGSSCTCKYLNDRTSYDNIDNLFENSSINPFQAINIPTYIPYPYRTGSKYIGV